MLMMEQLSTNNLKEVVVCQRKKSLKKFGHVILRLQPTP